MVRFVASLRRQKSPQSLLMPLVQCAGVRVGVADWDDA